MTMSYIVAIRNGSLAIDDGTFLIENHHQYNLSAAYVGNSEVFRPIWRKSAPTKRVWSFQYEKQAALWSSFSPTWSPRKANGLQSELRDLERGYWQPRGKKNADPDMKEGKREKMPQNESTRISERIEGKVRCFT